jgi:hypothetical protein
MRISKEKAMKNKLVYKGKQKRYTEEELKSSLDMIEDGASHAETLPNTTLNKSILAREIRKRKNSKGRKAAEAYDKFFAEETIKLFDKYVKNH